MCALRPGHALQSKFSIENNNSVLLSVMITYQNFILQILWFVGDVYTAQIGINPGKSINRQKYNKFISSRNSMEIGFL